MMKLRKYTYFYALCAQFNNLDSVDQINVIRSNCNNVITLFVALSSKSYRECKYSVVPNYKFVKVGIFFHRFTQPFLSSFSFILSLTSLSFSNTILLHLVQTWFNSTLAFSSSTLKPWSLVFFYLITRH